MAEAELRVQEALTREGRRRRWVYRGVIAVALVAVVVLALLYMRGFLPFDEEREYSHSYISRD